TIARAALLLPDPSACEICPTANTRSQHQTPARYQESVHPAHPKPPGALPQRDRLTGCARKSHGNCFLCLSREFQLAGVSSNSLGFVNSCSYIFAQLIRKLNILSQMG